MAGPQVNDARLSLEIRTKSVEQTLIPLVTQVGHCVVRLNHLGQRRHEDGGPFCCYPHVFSLHFEAIFD